MWGNLENNLADSLDPIVTPLCGQGKKKVSVVECEVETTCACRIGLCLQSHLLLLHFRLEENMKGGSRIY